MPDYEVMLIIAALIGFALSGGLLFAFSNSIMKAFKRLPDEAGIAAMNSINETIQNPLFFLVFFGPVVLGGAATIASWSNDGGYASYLLLAGTIIYFAGCLIVTGTVNVPLNNRLANCEPASLEGKQLWAEYLRRWTRWNHVRVVACIVAAVLFALALKY